MSTTILTAIGLMSGTSLDGVDVAIIRTDGEGRVDVGPAVSVPYAGATRAMVLRATKAALEGRDTAKDIADATRQVTIAQAEAVQHLLHCAETAATEIDVVGFHGQTILHRPPLDAASTGRTWQLGDGQLLADMLGIRVVNNFRQADMVARGQGAPLVPIYHSALVRMAGFADGATAVLNLGGVANITYVPKGGDPAGMIAFDCGPGNGLIDEWMVRHTGAVMDEDGHYASTGTVDQETVKLMALNPFLKLAPPKSLDRYDFKTNAVEALSGPDGAATLTAFTAECVARSAALLPEPPVRWVVCGGGRHNLMLMKHLEAGMFGKVLPAESCGWRGDFIEAECFGYLAVRSLKELPLSFPGTTGVARPTGGGTSHRPPSLAV